MEKHEIELVLQKITAEISDFTVSFAILGNRGGTEDADAAGSGSLVTVGSVDGILTAAHVLRYLPDQGEVGLIRFPRNPSIVQKQTIDMGQAQKVTISADAFGTEGPDLGFLRLPPKNVGALKATNVFFNLGMRQAAVLACDQPDSSYFEGISGVIAEWTTDLPPERRLTRVKGFHALFGVGLVVREHESNGFDLFDFEVTYDSGSESPDSFGGMSGGALWRVHCTKDDNGQLSISGKKIFGVAFYQSKLSDKKRIITCHGPRSVYGHLIDAIRQRCLE